jgi:hypothetical protein
MSSRSCVRDGKGIEKHAVGIVPSREDGPWDTIVGLEDIDSTRPTRLAELAAKSDFFPNVFYRPEWFDPLQWVGKRSDFLNHDLNQISAGQLRRDWISEPIFVKSIELNVLTGMVLQGPDRDWWFEECDHVPNEAQLVNEPGRGDRA